MRLSSGEDVREGCPQVDTIGGPADVRGHRRAGLRNTLPKGTLKPFPAKFHPARTAWTGIIPLAS